MIAKNIISLANNLNCHLNVINVSQSKNTIFEILKVKFFVELAVVYSSYFVVLLFVIQISMVSTVYAETDSIDNLSVSLVGLRGKVDDLNTRLEQVKEEHSQRMKYLYARRGELKTDIERINSNIKKQRKTLEKNQRAVRDSGSDSQSVKPVLLDAMSDLELYIRSSLPFKTSDRLAGLNELRSQLENDVVSPQKAANSLWAFYEDEIQLTRENGIFKQTLSLSDGDMLANVARLGMVLMYFQVGKERFGVFKKQSSTGSWQYEEVFDRENKERISNLFSSMKKQIRFGYFELPNGLPAMVTK